MISMKVKYLGDLSTQGTHLRSGARIQTDAPLDNNGKGMNYSPTDLICTALASCMMTLMGIAANKHNFPFIMAEAEIEKRMTDKPRKIDQIIIDLHVKNANYTQRQKNILDKAARTCPVAYSLHPDVVQDIRISFID